MKLDYKIIKTEEQYFDYCSKLEKLLSQDPNENLDEIELLTLLIEKWDSENILIPELDPIQLVKALMTENGINATKLSEILGLSKGTISKMLNYQKGLSKDTIRKLSKYFAISQESLNQPYKLKNPINRKFRNASLMNTKKQMEVFRSS